MEKSRVLVVGCGGCGNNLASTLMDLDKRITSIFFNTNLAEMENLKHFDRLRRCFYIPNADGVSKNRDLAELYIKEEAPKFAEMIKKFTLQDFVIFSGSSDGGTGSKAMTMLPRLVKKLCPEKSLNIICTFPNLSEGEKSFENTIDFWNELIDLKNKKIIDSIQFIDNNKCMNEQEINIRAMQELDNSFNVASGKVDNSDSKRVHSTHGYKIALKLDKSIRDTQEAIDKAMSTSVYFMPDNFDCDSIVANINSNDFKLEVVKKNFQAYDFTKFNENTDGDSTIVLGGCDLPREAIELAREALKELQNKKKRRVVEEDLIITKPKSETDKKDAVEVDAKSKLSSKDLNDMFDDDSFWN
jgi:hypothetical protein